MTKENIKKLIAHYTQLGQLDKVAELKESYKKSSGVEYIEEQVVQEEKKRKK